MYDPNYRLLQVNCEAGSVQDQTLCKQFYEIATTDNSTTFYFNMMLYQDQTFLLMQTQQLTRMPSCLQSFSVVCV